jgi:hypothetical protein
MHFDIFNLLLVVAMMSGFFRAMKRAPLVSRALKVRHFIVTVVVILLTSPQLYTAGFFITHPQLALADFYVSKGFAPAWLVFSLRIVDTVLGTIICVSTFALASRANKGRVTFLRVWPFLLLTWLIQSLPEAQSKARSIGVFSSDAVFAILAIFVIAVMGSIGVLIYWHFRSRASDVIFTRTEPPNTALEPTPTAP